MYSNFASTGDWMLNSAPDLEAVINAGVRTVIYDGDADYILNFMGVEMMVRCDPLPLKSGAWTNNCCHRSTTSRPSSARSLLNKTSQTTRYQVTLRVSSRTLALSRISGYLVLATKSQRITSRAWRLGRRQLRCSPKQCLAHHSVPRKYLYDLDKHQSCCAF